MNQQRKTAVPDLSLAAVGLLAIGVTFLPWWKFTETASVGGQTIGGSASVNAWNMASQGNLGKTITGPLAWIPMLLLLVLGALAVIRAFGAPQLLPGTRFYQVAVGVGGLAAVLVGARWITYFRPPNVDTGGVTASASSGASFGTYLGLLLGLAVVGIGVWVLRQPAATTAGTGADVVVAHQQNPYGTYAQPPQAQPSGYGQPQPLQPNPWVTVPQAAPDLQQTQCVPLPAPQPQQQYGQPAQGYGQLPPPGYPEQQPGQQQPPAWQ